MFNNLKTIYNLGLVIVLILSSVNIYSQSDLTKDIEFELGTPLKSKGFSYAYKTFCDGVIFRASEEDDAVVIRSFNPENLQLTNTKTYPLEGIQSKHFFIEGLISKENTVYMFYSKWDKEIEKEQLFYVEINPQNGQYIKPETKLFHVDGKVESNMGADKFIIRKSNDGSKFMVYYFRKNEIRNDKKNIEVVGTYVYDNKLHELWNTEMPMLYTENKIRDIGFKVSNDGKVLFLSLIYTDNNSAMKKKGHSINYRLELLKYGKGDEKVNVYPIQVENVFLKSYDFKELENGDIVIGGIYANGRRFMEFLNKDIFAIINNDKPIDTDGIYGIRINGEGKLVNSAYVEFPLSFLNSYEKNSTKKKNNKKGVEESNSEFHKNRETIIGDDGSVLCIGEQSWVKYDKDPDKFVNNIDFFYDDISVSKLNPNFKLQWIKKVPKRQVVYSQSYVPMEMSFVSFGDDNYLYLVYKDNEKKSELSENEFPKKCNVKLGGILTLSKINLKDGTVSKSKVFESTRWNNKFVQGLINTYPLKITDNDYLFEYMENRKEVVLSLIHTYEN